MAVPPGRPRPRTAFKNSRTIAPLHTSGPVTVTSDGRWILTCVEEDVLVTDLSTGTEICRFAGDTQVIGSLCITPSSSHVLVFTASLSLRIYEFPILENSSHKRIHPIRTIARAHDAPVHVCKSDPTSMYLASGSADGVVKVWDIVRGFVTHVFKGHGGVVSALTFSYLQDPSSVTSDPTIRLITASMDTRIRIFNLTAGASTSSGGGKPEAVLEGHVSVPRGLDVSTNGKWLVSGGRDSVVLIWDMSRSRQQQAEKSPMKKGKKSSFVPTLVKTIPTLERVEAVGLLDPGLHLPGVPTSPDAIHIYTGGEKGVVKIWDGRKGTVLLSLGKEHAHVNEDQEEQRQILDLLYIPQTSNLISVHADQNIICYSLSTARLIRQLIGYNDEIVDITFLTPIPSACDSHLALATNSSLLRVYSIASLDARLLEGHSDIVLAVDHGAEGRVLASGSKDRSARLWAPLVEGSDSWGFGCVGVCEGHAESIGAVVMSKKFTEAGTGLRFLFTGSQDRTIKMWDLSKIPLDCKRLSDEDDAAIPRCTSLTTHKAHEKDINSLDVSPNDQLLASGSQDRTAKIFEIVYSAAIGTNSARGELKLVGTCKGHKKGVWSVRFSRTERVLATGSGDKTVKLWNIDDFSCMKTFEGHTNSVLRVDFLNNGTQLVTAASDGLVKLWNIREEECLATLDNHEDKIWALAVSTDERTIVSGAADSVVTFWEDCTEEKEKEKETKLIEMVEKEQDFQNYIALNDYKKAIQLALAMEQPGRLLSLFSKIVAQSHQDQDSNDSVTGNPSVDQIIQRLAGSDLAKLLRYVRDWNTSAKNSTVAQALLYAIVKLRSADDVIKAFRDEIKENDFAEGAFVPSEKTQVMGGTALKDLVDALVSYTGRHLSRTEKLLQDSYVVDYILGEMDDGMFEGDIADGLMDVDLTVSKV